ncbi:hypothetical protein NMG60_11021549 [Bertholletia excelsa]
MGKVEEHQLHREQRQVQGAGSRGNGSAILCEGCSLCLSRIGREFNLKCVFVLIFSLSVFLPAMFWVLPLRSIQLGFDAKESIKHRATVQAGFILQKPVSMLVSHIGRLEYDIYSEIGVPDTKVAILSMHQAGASNWTNIVFGVLSDPVDDPINLVSLSVLRSSLIELFLQQSNLTLTTSIFGEPSYFEILKFQGGITVIPPQSASYWLMQQVLFNFTLHNSIHEIKENFVELKEQLKLGLHLRPYENVFVQLTNRNGSTRDPPVTVQASVTSDLGILLPQRLKQLAQTITGSPPANNLGLNNHVFGKVKEIRLSSYLNHTLNATPPTPSPAPAPDQHNIGEPSMPPVPSPDFHHSSPPCFNCEAASPSEDSYPPKPNPKNAPWHSFPPVSGSPAPSVVDIPSPHSSHCGPTVAPSPSPKSSSDLISPALTPAPAAFSPRAPITHAPPMGHMPTMSPSLPPQHIVSHGSSPRIDSGNGKQSTSPSPASPSISPSSSSFAKVPSYKEIWFLIFCGLLTFHLVCLSWW